MLESSPEETNEQQSGLGRQGLLLVVSRKTDGLSGKTIERVSNEEFMMDMALREIPYRVNLLQHLVDVGRQVSTRLFLLLSPFLVDFADLLGVLAILNCVGLCRE